MKLSPIALFIVGLSHCFATPQTNETPTDELTPPTSEKKCNSKHWDGTIAKSCVCCVMDQDIKKKVSPSKGRSVLNKCRKECPATVIKLISDEYNVAAVYPHEFINAILANNPSPEK